jgi:hypothetical protein
LLGLINLGLLGFCALLLMHFYSSFKDRGYEQGRLMDQAFPVA